MTTKDISFPADFAWGAATSAYQIEGGAHDDGRDESIWDRFAHTPGKIADGNTGDVACDSYHLYAQDVSLLQQLGVNSYRFSISWPRVIPQGRGTVNPAGLDYYDRLVDALLAAHIQPFATLYHWDLPQALQDEGGWANRSTVHAFVEYAELMVRKLGDRVTHWMTHNEPWCVALLGNYYGIFAPGLKDLKTALQVSHHLLLSHGLAVPAIRAAANRPLQVGIAPNIEPAYPASSEQADIDAAWRFDGFFNRWFWEPVAGKGYPQDMWEYYQPNVPEIESGDIEAIAVPIDFVGVNYYNRTTAKDFPESEMVPQIRNIIDPSQPRTDDREVFAPGLYEVLTRIHREYGFKSIYITENGAAFPDSLDEHGMIVDEGRIRFLKAHFEQAHRAIQDGVPLHGYFVWSLMDNFEWSSGFTLRYGISYVDFKTKRRMLKQSGHWLREYIATHK
jgi:beta-glucosidase